MLKGLKSLFESPKAWLSLLALKALAMGVFLSLSPNHWFWGLLWISGALYFYFFSESGRNFLFLGSFGLSLGAGWVLTAFPPFGDWRFFIAVFIWPVIFFLILGLKNLVFTERQAIYRFLNGLLFFSVLLTFMTADKTNFFVIKYLGLGFVFYLLFREFLLFNSEASYDSALRVFPMKLFSASLSFLALQFVWAAVLLPIGSLNGALLALFLILTLEDISLHSLKGSLDREVFFKDIGTFLFMTAILFVFSGWSP